MTDLSDAQRVQRAENARRALEGFLDPAFAMLVNVYSARMEEIAAREPWEAAKITALANGIRIAREVKAQIEAQVYDGEVVKQSMIRAEKIEKLTPAKRRLINIGPGW